MMCELFIQNFAPKIRVRNEGFYKLLTKNKHWTTLPPIFDDVQSEGDLKFQVSLLPKLSQLTSCWSTNHAKAKLTSYIDDVWVYESFTKKWSMINEPFHKKLTNN